MPFSHQDATDALDRQLVVMADGTTAVKAHVDDDNNLHTVAKVHAADGTAIGSDGDKLRVSVGQRSGTGIAVLDYEHLKIHTRDHFYYADHVELDLNDTAEYHIIPPTDGTTAHWVFTASTTGETEFELYEGITASSTGVELPSQNNFRSSISPDASLLLIGGSVWAGGTAIWRSKVGSGQGGAGATSENREIILDPTYEYVLKVTSSANDNIVTGDMEWYENAYVPN